MSFLTNKSLESLLQFSSLKGKVISENIANIGSKNYQRKDVKFNNMLNESMQEHMKTTNNKHMGFVSTEVNSDFEIVSDKGEDLYSGINNVDIDKEMSEMAANSLRYKFATKKLGKYYKNLQSVIKGE